MFGIVCFLIGLISGSLCTLPFLLHKQRAAKQKLRTLESQATEVRQLRERVIAKQEELDQRAKEFQERAVAKQQNLEQRAREVEQWAASRQDELSQKLQTQQEYEARKQSEFEQWASELKTLHDDLDKRVVTYAESQNENAILKTDLRNIDVHVQKQRLDHEVVIQRQRQLDERGEELAQRYLRDTLKSISSSLNPNNYAACKERLLDIVTRCREIGFSITAEEEAAYVADLKANYERVVRAALEREEQSRIKAQIREEEKLRREVEREVEQTNRERVAIQAALDKALAEAHDQHSDEVENLQARLAEAEARSQRAISMAEQTKAGNVYVISNIGSFGKDVFKVGMTRRLEPIDRIRELSDASVPFPFDVHMMISCDDAPALENALHRALHKTRINRVNPRKEFFRSSVDAILEVVRACHCDVQYVADPEAMEYIQSMRMTEEDAEYVESVYDAAEDDGKAVVED